jgi:hypothetical protein
MMGSLTVFQRTSQFGVSDAAEEGYDRGGRSNEAEDERVYGEE